MAPVTRGISLALVGMHVLLGVVGCQRTSSTASDASVPTPAATPIVIPSSTLSSGAPLSRLVPKPHVGPRSACPMNIVPGVSFGPIALGETLDDLRRDGMIVTNVSDTHANVQPSGGAGAGSAMKVSLCSGKIIEIWIDDLRLASGCVTYEGKAIPPAMPREDVEKLVGSCKAPEPRIGGAFDECNDGGLYVGHGMGTFLQLRVHPRGLPFDDTCAIASDDGAPVELSPKERGHLLRQVLNLSELSKYWHVDKPGRDPLRIVKTPLVGEQSLKMFGSDVVWIDEADAKKGSAYFVLSKLTATKTKANATFAYPIEGITGTAVFAHSPGPDGWRLESAIVAER